MIFDKSVQIKQLTVVEAHGILLVRTDRGRDSRMHVFRLSSFESDACGSEPAAFSRQPMKEQRLERTKGTHLYAVSRLGGSHLRMVKHETHTHIHTKWEILRLCEEKKNTFCIPTGCRCRQKDPFTTMASFGCLDGLVSDE